MITYFTLALLGNLLGVWSCLFRNVIVEARPPELRVCYIVERMCLPTASTGPSRRSRVARSTSYTTLERNPRFNFQGH
jgi:hypothetical protein